jgi:hypothetical protein
LYSVWLELSELWLEEDEELAGYDCCYPRTYILNVYEDDSISGVLSVKVTYIV